MDKGTGTLPQDVESLQALVSSLRETLSDYENKDKQQQARIAHQTTLIAQLLEQIKLARHQRFGASSEQWHCDQMRLFNEAEGGVILSTRSGHGFRL